MLIPPWILVTFIVIVAAIAIGSCLVMRRALNELFFWRGAFKCATDRACMLLAQVNDTHTSGSPGRVTTREKRGGGSASEGGRGAMLLRHYQGSLAAVMRTASKFRIDWVSDADADYFRDQYAPDDDPAVDWDGVLDFPRPSRFGGDP